MNRALARNLGVDAIRQVGHYFSVSTLVEIEKAAQRLSQQEKRELRLFLDAQLQAKIHRRAPCNLPPAERAAELRRWADAHEEGPGLPDSAVGRDAIYD